MTRKRASRVECQLCPKGCILSDGHRGDCRSRVNINGRIKALSFNRPVSVHLDPIEKKPLSHFHPGAMIFSLACAGCNLHCLGCQNWEISQANPEDVPAYHMTADQVVAATRRMSSSLIALTYTEPVVSYEYSMAIARAARAANMKTVLVTAAYCNPKPWRALCKACDAANIDLKFMDNDLYRKYTTGTVKEVLRNIEIALEERVWTEVTNLLLPGVNDKPGDVGRMARWLVEHVGPDVPLHLSRFSPRYKLTNMPSTPLASLVRGRQEAREAGLHHVYIGNVTTKGGNDTVCPHDGTTVIERVGYRIVRNDLGADGKCPTCKRPVAGVWSGL